MNYSKIKTSCLTLLTLMLMSMSVNATVIIYSNGHPIDTVAAAMGDVTLAAGNPAGGFGCGELAAAIGDGSSGSYGPYDALVLGENYDCFSGADQVAIANFTTNGGHTVVLGGHGDEVAFLNETFGYTVTHFAAPSADGAPISRVAGDGPATLKALNGSWFVESAPDTVLYTRDAGGDAAFVDKYGAGTVSWLAWDFCECGEPDADQADWFSVLGTAAIGQNVVPSGPAIPVPTLSELGLLALIMSVFLSGLYFRRKGWV